MGIFDFLKKQEVMPIDVSAYDFALQVSDIFTITGRGVIAVGTVKKGSVNVNDTVKVIGHTNEILPAKVVKIEMFRKESETAVAGDNVGLELEGVSKDNILKGYYIAK